MFNFFKRQIYLVIASMFVFSIIVMPSSAYFVERESKAAFAQEKELEYTQRCAAEEYDTEVDQKVITDLQLRLGKCKTDEERQALIEELEGYGSYCYTETEYAVQPLSEGSDVYLQNMSIFYNSVNDTWSVQMSGYWLNSNWRDNYEYDYIGNVGGTDAFGFSFTNTSGIAPAVSGMQAVVWNSNTTENSLVIYNRTDGSSSTGVGFRFQDKISGFGFLGDSFSAVVYFDDQFADFHGIATPYYIHTWADTKITSLTLGASGLTPSFNVTLNSEDDYFYACGTDVRF